MDRSKVSLVVPFFNEGDGVQCFYESIRDLLHRCGNVDFEIICVDDGSTDDTLSRLIAITEYDPRFLVIELSRNFGKEAALTAGIDAATGDAVIPMDADLQDPPELIPEMLTEWSRGAEVVLARRVDRSSDTYLKSTTAKLFYQIHNKLSPVRIPENVGDFRLMDRMVVNALKQLPEQQRFMKGLFAWVGFRTVTLDYRRNPRKEGKTKFSGSRLWGIELTCQAMPLCS
jgi:glycosyltransferase involved in cell wall biosynthesis